MERYGKPLICFAFSPVGALLFRSMVVHVLWSMIVHIMWLNVVVCEPYESGQRMAESHFSESLT